MLSRLLDPRDGKPRHPAFWLVVSAIALTQLLAFYVLCIHQVRSADQRRASLLVQQVASSDCQRSSGQSTTADCRASSVPGGKPSSTRYAQPANSLTR